MTNEMSKDVKVEPRNASAYDTARQRFTVHIVRETDVEFICASKYHSSEEFVLPKYAWQLA